MDLSAQREIRCSVESQRQAPHEPARIVAAYEDGGIGSDVQSGPILLTIEATNTQGELAAWLDDGWWTDVIEQWADCAVTVAIAPTPGALLHPVVLHHVEMLRRVAPGWRLIGHVYGDDLATDEEVRHTANSPYHEVRVFDQRRPGFSPVGQGAPVTVDELFGRIRREQSKTSRTRPALVRLPAGPTGVAAGPSSASQHSMEGPSPYDDFL